MAADVAQEEQFGPYLVYERLGVGGMATVHRALERGIEGFERVVALKRLLPHLAADGSFIKSFVREAKLASQLNHVNIVNIFELGRVGTEYFISMEYIDGRDIRRFLRHARRVSGPPPIHVTVGLLIQLCDALDYAHHKVDDDGVALGLVHRDVSPSNVLVTSAGQVKVIDFGIAKAQSIQLRTQTGRVKGKLAYMAPEALTGKPLDARSDLFAVGIIAHELLTARPLFATKNEYETLMKVQRGDIMPPSTFNQACPAELDAIVLRALARDPDDRFASAAEMRDELHAMRKQYHLQTSDRDIAMWIDWAFSLEAPGGSFTASGTFDPASSPADAVASAHQRPTKPKKQDDEDSIDIAWGGLDEGNNGAPIVLDDVPDVSEKHLGTASALGAEVRLDFDDLADDIPSSQPTHGIRPPAPSSRAATAAAMLARPHPRTRPPTPAAQLRSQVIPSQALREHDGATSGRVAAAASPTTSRPSSTTSAPPASGPVTGAMAIPPGLASSSVRGAAVPPRIRTITIPPISAGNAPGTRPSLSPPPPAGSLDGRGTPAGSAAEWQRDSIEGTPLPILTGEAMRSAGTPRALASAALPPASIPASSGPIPTMTGAKPAAPPTRQSQRHATVQGTMPAGSDSQPTERTPALGYSGLSVPSAAAAARAASDAAATHVSMPAMSTLMAAGRPSAEDFAMPSDTIPSMPAMQTSEPIVRFRAPSTPPPSARPSATDEADTPVTGTPAGTKPMTFVPRQLPVTPATALFAEQAAYGDDDDSLMTIVSSPSHHLEIVGSTPLSEGSSSTRSDDPEPPQQPSRRPNRRALAAIAGTLALGGAIAVAALYLTRDHGQSTDAPPPRSEAVAHTGTLKLTTMPTDAAITIAGQPAHLGSPWSVDLAPGIHQIEIHRNGYKAWLTSVDVVAGQARPMNVVLDPLDPAVIVANATLLVDPPRGHEVVLDGTAIAGDAPSRHSLAIGTHTVVLRKDGVDVWKTTFDAKSAAVYDLTPIMTRQAEHEGSAAATGSAAAATGSAAPADDAVGTGSATREGSQLGTITPAATPPVPAPPPR